MNLKISELTKKYGNYTAVNNISLSIKSKSVFGLLGPNGAGKTSIIRILSGLSKPDKGHITIGNLNFKNQLKEVKKVTGIVPQFRNLDYESSVYQNLYFHGKLYKLESKMLKSQIYKLLERFNLLNS